MKRTSGQRRIAMSMFRMSNTVGLAASTFVGRA
jgi:hypothetical protein